MSQGQQKFFGDSRAVHEALNLSRSVTGAKLQAMTGLTPGWVKKFRQGQIEKPGFQKVERIFEAFGYNIKAVKPKTAEQHD